MPPSGRIYFPPFTSFQHQRHHQVNVCQTQAWFMTDAHAGISSLTLLWPVQRPLSEKRWLLGNYIYLSTCASTWISAAEKCCWPFETKAFAWNTFKHLWESMAQMAWNEKSFTNIVSICIELNLGAGIGTVCWADLKQMSRHCCTKYEHMLLKSSNKHIIRNLDIPALNDKEIYFNAQE